jgi:uncharacterized protein Yka (UPF0111/DUF47 family)
MANQDLLTILLALIALAVLIQTGIAIGLYFVSMKISRQADRAVEETQRLFGPIHRMVDMLDSSSNRITEFSASTQVKLRQWERQFDQMLDRLRRKVAS